MKTLKKNGREGKIPARTIFMLTILLLAFGIPKVQAAVVYFDTADPFVEPGETIPVSIFSTVITSKIRMDRISDDDFGMASNLYLNPEYTGIVSEGILINENGILIEDILTTSTPISPQVSGVLYSFDYLVPIAPFGHRIRIFADQSGSSVNQVSCWINDDLVYIKPDSLTLTVVPEPASIILLGFGTLFLRKTRQWS